MITANPKGRVFWAGLLLILAAFTATAQEFRGSLAGKITDPNGAVVPGSKVEIKNIETGVVTSAMTGDDGSEGHRGIFNGRNGDGDRRQSEPRSRYTIRGFTINEQ